MLTTSGYLAIQRHCRRVADDRKLTGHFTAGSSYGQYADLMTSVSCTVFFFNFINASVLMSLVLLCASQPCKNQSSLPPAPEWNRAEAREACNKLPAELRSRVLVRHDAAVGGHWCQRMIDSHRRCGAAHSLQFCDPSRRGWDREAGP